MFAMRRIEAELPPGPGDCVRDNGGRRENHLAQACSIPAAAFALPRARRRILPAPADNFAEYRPRLLSPLPGVLEISQSNGLLSRNRLRVTLAHFLVSASVTLTLNSLTLRGFKAKIFLSRCGYTSLTLRRQAVPSFPENETFGPWGVCFASFAGARTSL